MALAKIPGPEGLGGGIPPLDPDPLSRGPSSVPGPAGLWYVPQVSQQAKAVGRSKGITIHPESKISAQEWLKKIKASDDVPDYFKNQISAKGNVILVTNPKKFKVPRNVISKDWLEDWLSAFVSDEWEMTTGELEFTVKKGDDKGPFITVVHNPDLAGGETITGFTRHTMTEKGRDTTSISVERGNTLPTGVTLKSGKKLIVVATRIKLDLEGKIKTLQFEDSELLEVWFHEIAAHAGRNSTKKTDVHGDKTVDGFARDIADMFPKTTTVAKVLVEIKSFLEELKKTQSKQPGKAAGK
jgi:hypothetical protein